MTWGNPPIDAGVIPRFRMTGGTQRNGPEAGWARWPSKGLTPPLAQELLAPDCRGCPRLAYCRSLPRQSAAPSVLGDVLVTMGFQDPVGLRGDDETNRTGKRSQTTSNDQEQCHVIVGNLLCDERQDEPQKQHTRN